MLKQMLLAVVVPAGLMVTVPAPHQRAKDIRLEVTSTGNEARYRVREQLAGFDLPNDAIGRSSEVSGAIVLDEQGRVVPAQSRIVVNVAELRSDRDRRDGYVRRAILKSDSFPTTTLAPTDIRGLQWPLPASGQASLTLAGDLTVKGITRPTAWNVTANFVGDTISGAATTAFTFADFGLDQPRVPIVLSVGDTIRLEYDFRLVRTPASSSP